MRLFLPEETTQGFGEEEQKGILLCRILRTGMHRLPALRSNLPGRRPQDYPVIIRIKPTLFMQDIRLTPFRNYISNGAKIFPFDE